MYCTRSKRKTPRTAWVAPRNRQAPSVRKVLRVSTSAKLLEAQRHTNSVLANELHVFVPVKVPKRWMLQFGGWIERIGDGKLPKCSPES